MSLQPLVSVCIPCYNGELFIAATLQSILNQSLTDFEVVLCDDQSSDQTVSIISRFGDPRVRLFRNETNLGLGRNWNRTLSLVRGKYVKLLCEDDLLHRECLSRQVEALEDPANANACLAVCSREIIDPQDRVVFRRKLPFPAGAVRGARLIRSSVRWGTNLIGEPVVGLFRREVLLRTRMCDPSNPYLIDLGLWAELLKHGDAFLDPDCLAAFRISHGAASAKIGRQQARFFRRFVRCIRRDPAFGINALDVVSGSLFSLQWCLLRNLFYHLYLGRESRRRHHPELPAANQREGQPKPLSGRMSRSRSLAFR